MPPTTKPMMDLRALVEKSADADLLREMIGFAAERLSRRRRGAGHPIIDAGPEPAWNQGPEQCRG
ncbi:hypothetical protein FJM51_22265 [Amaricoccus solimangrovi]|uniref:IS256 family transposase n=1 Tax=Amaricoccus solimangrovi TaxID=2589815 RepID=A0A501W8S9_9RHOB|nr:hypothetical protein FJM51_22265 [Amaricoccus solimangrovi]